jgi:ACS family hexuronate transporter-like MFS transporter
MGFNDRAKTAAAPPPIPAWKWQVVWLMFLATMINYMDRQTMASTSSYIMKEFDLTETGYARLQSAFGLSYAVSQIFAGFLADRLNLRWLYAAALLVWSAAGFLTGLADTVLMLMACRIVLGFGEAFNWPCAITVVRRVVPREARSLANGIFHSGTSVGAALTPLVVVALVGRGGEHWRSVFIVVGAAGLAWAVLWFISLRGERAREIDAPATPDEPPDAAKLAEPAPPFVHVFLLRRFWLALAASISVNLFWHFFNIWLPRLLERDQGLSPHDLQYVLVGFYLSADLGSMGAGYLTRRLTHAGLSVERSRKVMMFVTSVLCLLSAPAAFTHNLWVAVPLIFIAAAGSLGGFANMFALSQEISARHTAQCVGLIGALAWFLISGLNLVVGRVVDRIGTFVPVLLVVAIVPLIGAILGLLWPERPRPQPGSDGQGA